MSDVTRYTAVGDGVVKTDPAGPLIEYTDYATLKAENEEMHKDYEALADEHTKLIERLTNCKSEADRLKAEVERLKAELADEKSANASVEGRLNSANRGLSMRNHLLQAEVERLRKFNDEALAHIAKEERKSRERLDIVEAEVERLRKAGDAMVFELEPSLKWNPDSDDICYQVRLWNAAKEGKQP